MRHIITVLLLLFICENVQAQTAPLTYWVEFTDKDNTPYSIISPEVFLSQDAINRRVIQGIAIDEKDLPVDPDYVSSLAALEGVKVKHVSKWMNAATIVLEDSSYVEPVLDFLTDFVHVNSVKSAVQYTTERQKSTLSDHTQKSTSRYYPHYGPSFNQIAIHNGHLIHELGFTGSGMKIGVLDAGFDGINFLEGFQKLRDEEQIKLQYDVVDDDANILNGGHHGKSVLSIMAAFMPDSLIGTAPDADYYLFRTEDVSSEHITEEDNWIRALEMADSIGVQLINSSLGYTRYDFSENSHTYEDMDGNTTRISRAADIASSRGILMVNSAGNSGDDPWYYIGAPADADSTLAVGAVNELGEIAFFSSRGPSSDGDVKPNVCGVGQQTVYADLTNGIKKGNGTSFSAPVITGLAACLWQAFPDKTNMEIKHAIEESAHLYSNPNDSLGYGIPDFLTAFNLLKDATDESLVEVFPNPFQEEFSLIINSDEVSKIEIADASGRIVKELDRLVVGDNNSVVTLSLEELNLKGGSYFLRVFTMKNELSITKLIKF